MKEQRKLLHVPLVQNDCGSDNRMFQVTGFSRDGPDLDLISPAWTQTRSVLQSL